MNIYIIRNNQKFGPYTESALLSYVNNGQVLVQDKAIKDGDLQEHTVSYYLRQCGLRPKVTNKGNILDDWLRVNIPQDNYAFQVIPYRPAFFDISNRRVVTNGYHEHAFRGCSLVL